MNDQSKMVAVRIKELRDIMEIEPSQVAEKVGCSVSEYMKYEDGELDIPISMLYTIAGVLEVDPTVLLSGESPRMTSYTIVRKGKGMKVQRYAEYSFSSLAFNFSGRDMEPMIVNLLPKSTPPELVTHGGQEFNMVLEGKVCVLFGNHKFILEAGDSIYFDPKIPHGQDAVDGPAKFLTVINDFSI